MELFILSVAAILLTYKAIATDQRICWYTSRTVGQISVQQVEPSADYANEFDYGSWQIKGPNQTCPKRTKYCYALWKEVQHNHSVETITIIAQGCWESSGKQDCENANCITRRKPPKALNDTNFCCCKGNFCNGNVTQSYYPDDIEILPIPDEESFGKPYILILAVVLVLLLVAASCPPAYMILVNSLDKSGSKKTKSYADKEHLAENGLVPNPYFTKENLKLEKLIGQGRYGSVWKGSVGDQEVAVKIFQSHHRNYFYNELDIYCVPFMAHPTLLSYLGYDERIGVDGNTEYLLFLSLVPNGTVQDFLSLNTVDWNTFCKMSLSIAKGVAYLHSDIRKGGKFKPCVSHRDLNTKNILVREDMNCVICDLGFATKLNGSKYYANGEEQHAEVKSINDVGTLRYMSPEVLEGAVNLRDCETALKQIDVYALGLILWELSTRCTDFYPMGIECAPYRLPFEAEVGHPTFEQMQILVCKHKARPLFPDMWRDSQAVRSVKETIEDCWDQDAEARLTALCVEERFHELSGMSERQKVVFYSSSGINLGNRTSLIQKDSQNILTTGENKEENFMAESTINASLVVSPINPKNSNRYQGVRSVVSVQPYQGRNPCLERNLMLSNDTDSNSNGFIHKSHKSIASSSADESSDINEFISVNPNDSTTENNTNLSYNSYANHSEPTMRSVVPIPFLQNVKVKHATPKQSNLPKSANHFTKISWKNLKKLFEGKQKVEDLSPQIDYNVKTTLISNENYGNLSTPVAAEPKLETQILLYNGKLETKLDLQNYSTKKSIKQRETRTDYPDASTNLLRTLNKRPDTLPLTKSIDISYLSFEQKMNTRKMKKILKNNEKTNFSQDLLESEKLYSQNRNSLAKSLTNSSTISSDDAELKTLRLPLEVEECTECQKCMKVVDSKKLVVESFLEQDIVKGIAEKPNLHYCNKFVLNTNLHCQGARMNKDLSLRVKTTEDVNLVTCKRNSIARFSLYDDRIMSGTCNDEKSKNELEPDHYLKLCNSFENIKFTDSV